MSKAIVNTVRLGDLAPDFVAQTTDGEIRLHEYLGDSWGLLFSHPADFTPICTTELGRVAQLAPEWAKRNVKVLGLSCDDLDNHRRWVAEDICPLAKVEQLSFPLIADESRQIALLYGMLDEEAAREGCGGGGEGGERGERGLPLTVRSVFVISPDKKIKLILTYPASTGRNFDEIIRCVDSLQATAYHKVGTPAEWKRGDQVVILPSVSDEEAKQLFPDHNAVRPYLRFTKDPQTPSALRSFLSKYTPEELYSMSPEQLNEVWSVYDKDGNGSLERQELTDLAGAIVTRLFDGFKSNIRELLRKSPGVEEKELSDDEIESRLSEELPNDVELDSFVENCKADLLSRIDDDENGKVSKEEFVSHWNEFSQEPFRSLSEDLTDCAIL